MAPTPISSAETRKEPLLADNLIQLVRTQVLQLISEMPAGGENPTLSTDSGKAIFVFLIAQVIEHHDAGTATQSAKRFLVQLGPDARAGAEAEQAYRLATVAERQHKQSRASRYWR